MKQPILCRYCKWGTTQKGKWKAHFELRLHVRLNHPTEFAEMNRAELAIMREIGALMAKFGAAAKSRYQY